MDYTPYYNISVVGEFVELVEKHVEPNTQIEIKPLNKTTCLKNSEKYSVIRYNKNLLTSDSIKTHGLFRSVILNKLNNVVCFSPPKSVDAEEFMKAYPEPTSDENKNKIVAEEFVEGTMINVFWDPAVGLNGAWEIATRNTVGGESAFYKKPGSKTFKTMFLEALSENNLHLDGLCRDYCYSFVLQHPENRIVVPFTSKQLYLVAIYSIVNKENDVHVYIHSLDRIKNLGLWSATGIKFPEQYIGYTYEQLIEKFASHNTPYNVVGFMLKNLETGVRCKVRNPVYEEVRKLRGNQPKIQYQYLMLRKEGKVKDFLKYYPECKKEFSMYRDQVHNFTQCLYNMYVSCYIKKTEPLIKFSEQYRTHMFNIHQQYLKELKPNKQHITNTFVMNYVNNLPTTLLMHSLNYSLKQRSVDLIISGSTNEEHISPE